MKGLVLGIWFVFVIIVEVRADKVKFEELTREEFNMNVCDFYPEAKAVILTRLGNIDFVALKSNQQLDKFILSNVDFRYRYGEGMRIKILDDAEKDLGNVKIQFYVPEGQRKGGDNQEKILDITGCTYNLQDGKIIKEELKKSDIYTKRLNDRWMEVSFALPNVKKGSVIEYSYTKTSPHVENLESWNLQTIFPVCYNELVYNIPEYFDFQARVSGEMHELERNVRSTSVYLGGESVSCQQVQVIVRNIPPVEEEPFVCNPCDLPMRVDFQLVAIHFPDKSPRRVAGTYEEFNKQLLGNDRFWKMVSRDNFSKDFKLKATDMSDQEKVNYLLKRMRETVVWNREGGFLASRGSKDCIKDKDGNVADINLTLTGLFRANGLEAYPVILSTRGNGSIHPVYPNYNDFNYVISAVNVDGKLCFCDATVRGPCGLLPLRCLNGNGWLVAENGGSLVPLKGKGMDISNVISTICLKDDKMEATVDLLNKEYAAMQIMGNYEHQGAEKYRETMQEKFVGWEFSDYVFEENDEHVSQTFKLEKPCEYTDVIYVQPFLFGIPTESLFKRDTRRSDIDFPNGIQHRVVTTVNIPEGYEVEQMPEEIGRSLSNNGALFAFEAFKGNNEVTFSVTLVMRKLNYTAQEYPELKAFFDQFAGLSKVMLVLKKK